MNNGKIVIAAFDLATKTGYCVNGEQAEGGMIEFPVGRGESPGSRYMLFVKWAKDFLKKHQPDLVLYEQFHMRGGAATEIACGLATHLQTVCAMLDINHANVHSLTLKAHALGDVKGNKKQAKELMIKACVTKLDIIPDDDNHCDAIWLHDYGLHHYDTVELLECHKP